MKGRILDAVFLAVLIFIFLTFAAGIIWIIVRILESAL
jgi:hypothetical protein